MIIFDALVESTMYEQIIFQGANPVYIIVVSIDYIKLQVKIKGVLLKILQISIT